MIPRSIAVPTLLAASVAVPYVATNARQWRREWNSGNPAASASGAPIAPPLMGADGGQSLTNKPPLPAGPGPTIYPTVTPLEGTPTYSLAEVLRMDVTKEWVYQRWPRKSTALSELDLYGVRVPLVTGTKIYDLAGSLTYFFDANGRVQRISFRGKTGDTTQVVGLVTQRYGLQQQPAAAVGEQLFQTRRGNDVLSQLHTRPAPVLWANSPHESFTVELDLQDPAAARPLALELPLPPPAPIAPPQTAQAANAGAASANQAATSAADASATSDAEKESGWKAFFPRRKVPASQIPNLDHGNIYQ